MESELATASAYKSPESEHAPPQAPSNRDIGFTQTQTFLSVDQQRRFFVGNKYDVYYKEAFAKVEQGRASMNYAAFGFGLLWLAYRKQYARLLAFLAASFAIDLAVYAVLMMRGGDLSLDDPTFRTATVGGYYGLAGLLGSFANKWYLDHLNKQVEGVKRRCAGMTPKVALTECGGIALWRTMGLAVSLIFLSYAGALFSADVISVLTSREPISESAVIATNSPASANDARASLDPDKRFEPLLTPIAIPDFQEAKEAPGGQRANSIDLLENTLVLRYDDATWTRLEPNGSAAFRFQRADGEAFAQIIVERLEVTDDVLRQAAILNFQKVDPNVRMLSEERRTVGGKDVWIRQYSATANGLNFVYLNWYYTGQNGTIQVMTWTTSNLFDRINGKLETFLEGLEFQR